MMTVELSREELALESVELLPDRQTMQLLSITGGPVDLHQSNTATQTNTADVNSSASGVGSTGGAADVTQSNYAEQSNYAGIDTSASFDLEL